MFPVVVAAVAVVAVVVAVVAAVAVVVAVVAAAVVLPVPSAAAVCNTDTSGKRRGMPRKYISPSEHFP